MERTSHFSCQFRLLLLTESNRRGENSNRTHPRAREMQRPSSSPQPGETQEGVRTTDVAIRGLDAKGQQSKVDVKKAAIIGGSLLLVAVVAIVLIVVLAGGSSSSHHDAPLPQDDGTGDTLTGINTTGLLPPERATTWNPGLNAVGGIPHRTAIFKTLSPSGGDDTALINKAIEDCPANQVRLFLRRQ